MSPPVAPSTADSAMNWTPVCHGRAPSVRRSPISSTRFKTDTSVVLAIPTAPMTRHTTANTMIISSRSPVTLARSDRGSPAATTLNISGASGRKANAIWDATREIVPALVSTSIRARGSSGVPNATTAEFGDDDAEEQLGQPLYRVDNRHLSIRRSNAEPLDPIAGAA
jgi:hypothetical protein